LEELHGLARVDLLHQVAQAVATVHQLCLQDLLRSGEVLVRQRLVHHNIWVDICLGEVEALISPLLEVAVIKLTLVDGVATCDLLTLSSEPGPILAVHWQVVVATVVVSQGVPNCVEVACSTDIGQVLKVATSISVGVVVIHERGSVQRLMQIANIVDNQPEGERASVSLVREGVLDGLVIDTALIASAGTR